MLAECDMQEFRDAALAVTTACFERLNLQMHYIDATDQGP
jgi:hypothetical protein